MSAHFSKTRIETFSDGIFAIIITLLVLEIKVPHINDHHSATELAQSLLGLVPKLISWIISFLIVCVIWINHHRLLDQVGEIDNPLFWLNANLLLWCSFIPFPTALMGDYFSNPLALSAFGIILSLSALAFTLIRMYIRRHPETLRAAGSPTALSREVSRSFLFGPLLYWAGSSMAWINPYIALLIYFLIPVYFIFPKPKPNQA